MCVCMYSYCYQGFQLALRVALLQLVICPLIGVRWTTTNSMQ